MVIIRLIPHQSCPHDRTMQRRDAPVYASIQSVHSIITKYITFQGAQSVLHAFGATCKRARGLRFKILLSFNVVAELCAISPPSTPTIGKCDYVCTSCAPAARIACALNIELRAKCYGRALRGDDDSIYEMSSLRLRLSGQFLK